MRRPLNWTRSVDWTLLLALSIIAGELAAAVAFAWFVSLP